MSENGTAAKRPDTVYVSYTENVTPEGVENQDFIVCRIGTGKKSLTKYEVILPIPNVEKCLDSEMTLKDFFAHSFFSGRGLDPQSAIIQLARKIGTGPMFETCVNKDAEPTETQDPTAADKPFLDYPLVKDGHAKMQQLMDGYELGRKPSETAVEKAKAKAALKKMDSLESAMAAKGWTLEQIQAMIEKKAPPKS